MARFRAVRGPLCPRRRELAKPDERRFHPTMNFLPRASRFFNLSGPLRVAIPVLVMQVATQTPVFAADAAVYPLKTCVVTDEKLGSMGKAYVHSHEGQEVQFCCKSCIPKFNKDPQKYLKKIADAAKAQAK